MRWLTDEGIPKAISEWLRQRGDDVFEVAVSDKRGCEDLVLWQLAGDQQRVVVTRDLKFLLPDVSPLPLGVVMIRVPDTFQAKAIFQLFQETLDRVEKDSLLGSVTVVQPGRIRQRRFEDLGFRQKDSND